MRVTLSISSATNSLIFQVAFDFLLLFCFVYSPEKSHTQHGRVPERAVELYRSFVLKLYSLCSVAFYCCRVEIRERKKRAKQKQSIMNRLATSTFHFCRSFSSLATRVRCLVHTPQSGSVKRINLYHNRKPKTDPCCVNTTKKIRSAKYINEELFYEKFSTSTRRPSATLHIAFVRS